MDSVHDTTEEMRALREENARLAQQVVQAHDALAALARGEVDSVSFGPSATPILLKEAQRRLLLSESQLMASRDMLEEAQAIAHVGSWASGLSPDGQIQWSREAARILGVPQTPMAVPAFFEIVHPDDRERFRQALRDALDHGAPAEIEHRIGRPDGSVRWVSQRGSVQRDAGGRPTGMIGTVQDVTDRHAAVEALKQANARLAESEALLSIAGRAAGLGGWSVSLAAPRVTWSDVVCAIHEVPPGTVPSLEQAIAFYVPESRPIIARHFDACARDGTPFDLELQILTALGRRVWVRAIGDAGRSAAGAITTVRGAFQNVDERRRLQEQFRHAQKMEAVGRLAGGVAHDFNNLLSVILSYAQMAMDGLKAGDPLRDDIGEMKTAGERATVLTRQLLAFSRQQVLEPRVIDLNVVIDAMKPMLKRLLGEDIALSVLTARPVGRVLADPGQIEQVVMNLAVNARDAMPGGGLLTIETSVVSVEPSFEGKPASVAPGVFVLLAVTDNGQGMPESTRVRVFEPFFTTKEVGKGTGLGLATVFGIVQQSGGYVTVYSELGHGTTFKIYLPRTDRAAEALASEAPTSLVESGSETILLVEDEEQVRTVACVILRKHGYHVLEAANGGEAYMISNDFAAKIDLVLTDVVMPRMSGRKLAEQLARQRPEMRVLFASGYTDDAIIQHGVLDAGVEFIQKPFTPHALLRKVRQVLDRR